MFRTIFELGMFFCPEEIGFIFHKDAIVNCSCFELACEIFGVEKVVQVVNRIILHSTQGRHDRVKTMLFAAVTNKAIYLERLYTLVCLHPVVLWTRSKRGFGERTTNDMYANYR